MITELCDQVNQVNSFMIGQKYLIKMGSVFDHITLFYDHTFKSWGHTSIFNDHFVYRILKSSLEIYNFYWKKLLTRNLNKNSWIKFKKKILII